MSTAARLLATLLVAFAARAEELLVLKDGRRLTVARLVRRDGQVVLETRDGRLFSVPEDQVASPPLEAIPADRPPAAPAEPPTAPPGTILVLRDGRRIAVARLARRASVVVFETTRGERFSVPEEQVASPALESIPSLQAAPPMPEAAPPPPLPEPATEPPPAPAPSPSPAAAPDLHDAGFLAMPDRWRIAYPDSPRFARGRTADPYHQNRFKGDRPISGDDVFLNVSLGLETPLEARRLPVAPARAGGKLLAPLSGRGDGLVASPRAAVSLELYRGHAALRPRSWALKASLAFARHDLRFRQGSGEDRESVHRRGNDLALGEAWGEVKLADLSPRYDFLSLRLGVQPFSSDFRGLLFRETNLGVRLFGNAADNRVQYNLALFDLLERDTNTELVTFARRRLRVLAANVYLQDGIAPGFTVSASYHHAADTASRAVHEDANGLVVRPAPVFGAEPHDVTAHYVGLAGDGHLGRLNLSTALFAAFGRDRRNPVAGRAQRVRAGLAAVEASVDRDWARFKATAVLATGDGDPADGRGTGFDAVLDRPSLAGGAFSFWSRSALALPGTALLLKSPGTLLPHLRAGKTGGQASFVNPGLVLFGLGAQADLTPKLRAVANLNHLRFHRPEPLESLLGRSPLRRAIGLDWGAGVVYRPSLDEHVVIEAGLTGLLPGAGLDDLVTIRPCGGALCQEPSRSLWSGFVSLRLVY
jgi:hypothetical protein